ncbi:serine hydrolase [Lachnoclostridium edouardi]|uniref:serine hydrolase n=1 Tax=Lachnoclostridium edouardi TaxID=1926283 RepID=UPI000C7CA5A4|nr:serine hydrolase [Lachnoclostridium edouardi]
MKKYRILPILTLVVCLTAGQTVYGAPSPTDFGSNVTIVSEGPGERASSAAETETQVQPQTSVKSDSSAVTAPEIQSEGAVLLDAATGKVLYGKNENEKFYPASITKLMTGLLVVEKCSLDDTVTFSSTATTNLESGAVSLNLTEGDKLTVKDCMYALMLKSANEVANGLAEHVAGSNSKFADMMNERAAALGCKNTHFTNPHGLNDTNHYSTPYDMALIARAAFNNETFRKIDSTLSYQIPATKKVSTPRTVTMGHKMFYSTDSRYYPGIIGGKTGYTSKAGNTLVTGVDKDGVRLIAVIMKSKSTHYQDTKALLDFGFENREQLLSGTASGPASSPASESGPASEETSSNSGWQKAGEKWNYIKEDGSKAANEWLTIGGEEYWFDSDTYMATGWRQYSDNSWYYFRSSGAMAKNYWVKNNGKWFYLGSDGAMMKNTITPDGYVLDETGAWVQ